MHVHMYFQFFVHKFTQGPSPFPQEYLQIIKKKLDPTVLEEDEATLKI